MHVSDIADYLIKLEREKFTGKVVLNFHKGGLSLFLDKTEKIQVSKSEEKAQ